MRISYLEWNSFTPPRRLGPGALRRGPLKCVLPYPVCRGLPFTFRFRIRAALFPYTELIVFTLGVEKGQFRTDFCFGWRFSVWVGCEQMVQDIWYMVEFCNFCKYVFRGFFVRDMILVFGEKKFYILMRLIRNFEIYTNMFYWYVFDLIHTFYEEFIFYNLSR